MPDVVHIESPNGVVIAADHWTGTGTPVVLAHGGGQTRYSWGGTAEALARSGSSGRVDGPTRPRRLHWAPDRDYTMDAFRDDALAVADWIGEPVAWVGASLGGMTGLHAVHQRPEAFDALVLVDITPRPAAGRREPHPRVHGRQRGRGFRHARRSSRRDRRLPAPPTAPEGPVRAGQEPPARRRRPVALALGPGLPRHPSRAARASTPATLTTMRSARWRAASRCRRC